MSEYSTGVNPDLNKNIQTDYNEGWRLVRTITAIEAPVWTPGILHTALESQCFKANCKKILLRVFSDTAAAAPVIIVAAEPPPGPPVADRTHTPYPMAETAFHGTLTMSGRQCALLHPITNEVSAATWNACSNLTAGTGHPTNIVTQIPTAAAAGYETLFLLDTLGRTLFYPYCTNISTASSLLIAMKRLE